MKTVSVEFQVEIPVEATEEEIEEWVRFCLGEHGSMCGDNPLSCHDLQAEWGSVMVDSF
jgi:hypothetical protein